MLTSVFQKEHTKDANSQTSMKEPDEDAWC